MDPLIRIPIRLAVGLINALVYEREEYHKELKCVNGYARPLSDNLSNLVDEDRLRVLLEKDIEVGDAYGQ